MECPPQVYRITMPYLAVRSYPFEQASVGKGAEVG